MAIGVGELLQCQLQFTTTQADRAMNVWHFIVTEAAIQTDAEFCQAVTDDLAFLFNQWLSSQVSSGVSGTTAVWSIWDVVNNSWMQVAESDFNAQGLSLGDLNAHGTAGLIQFPGTNSARKGRKFIYGLTEGAQSGGRLVAITATALAGYGANMLQEIGDIGAKVQAVIFQGSGQFNPVTGEVFVDQRIAYQRRRKQGVGW